MFEQAFKNLDDARWELGNPSDIGKLFAGVQKYLYEKSKVA